MWWTASGVGRVTFLFSVPIGDTGDVEQKEIQLRFVSWHGLAHRLQGRSHSLKCWNEQNLDGNVEVLNITICDCELVAGAGFEPAAFGL
jgi:hypothetical protein